MKFDAGQSRDLPTKPVLANGTMPSIQSGDGNPRLKGVLPKDYARPGLDKHRLGELTDLIGTIALLNSGSSSGRESAQISLGDDQSRLTSAAAGAEKKSHRSFDLLGRVFEYFLTQFASAEGKNGGPAKCEIQSASVEVPPVRNFPSFVIRHFPTPHHAPPRHHEPGPARQRGRLRPRKRQHLPPLLVRPFAHPQLGFHFNVPLAQQTQTRQPRR